MKNFILSSLIFSLSALNAQDVQKSISSNIIPIEEGYSKNQQNLMMKLKDCLLALRLVFPI